MRGRARTLVECLLAAGSAVGLSAGEVARASPLQEGQCRCERPEHLALVLSAGR